MNSVKSKRDEGADAPYPEDWVDAAFVPQGKPRGPLGEAPKRSPVAEPGLDARGPERRREAWRIGEYPQRLCHVLKEMVEEKAAHSPERRREAWRIGEYPQRLCHVLKEMVEEKAAHGPERRREAWRIGEYPQRLCHVLKEMVEEKAAHALSLSRSC
ncbi:uncharacterized protein LOC125686200 isoform X1 [Lagopus muta]|uniref:uncharacterized protein LOC125686200 isoform X1 n=1 Tax=Lagopus muta TaxID=64668 RepID=UPI0020A1C872|nr:uncharacterized protein LOC125686200 isoform X1 [Lagopus muta]